MLRRDFGVILLSIFALYWSLQHEGAFEYRKAFYYDLPKPDELQEFHAVPAPVVADLNGDGGKEVIVVTQDLELHLLGPQLASRFERGFAPAVVKGKKTLDLPSILTGARTPLAMKAGYIDPPEHDFVHVPRKMVVVIVTKGWVVICLDHNMNVLWETSIHDHFPRHASTREISIHISHHNVKEGDRGMVVVGGTVSFGVRGGGEEDSIDDLGDEVDAEIAAEEDAAAHSKSVEGTELRDIQKDNVDLSRNFQLHALEGASGEPRWRNAGADFRKDLDRLQQETIPQHNYRLDAASLESRRFGEVSCRDFREAIIRNLPHAWGRKEDTRMHEAHFAKHRTARDSSRGDGKKADAAKGSKRDATGGSGASFDADYAAALAAQPPNALVAHTEEGMSIVNLFTGQPICTLTLAPHSLHTDVNGDGVLDHVIAIADTSHAHKGHHMHDYLNPCSAYVYSGYPPKTPLFNGTVCSPSSRATATALLTAHRNAVQGKGGAAGGNEGGGAGQGRLLMESPPPVALPAPPPHDGGGKGGARRHGRRSHPVFLTSFGDLTMYDASGGKRWQRRTAATWANSDGELPGERVEPTLALLPMRQHAVPTAVLAAGTHTAVVYNIKGVQVDTFDLPGSPVAPLLQCSFSGNGLTDLILVTPDAIYGFQLLKNMGAGMPYATMMGGLLIAVVVVFVTQQGPLGSQKTRSTDRID